MTGVAGAVMWLTIAVALFVIESLTVQLICVWFAFGALLAMVASALGAPFVLQLAVFLIASAAVLVPGRRIVREKLQRGIVPTNADAVIGKIGVVKEGIDNLQQTGRVTAGGLDWTARTEWDGVFVPVGSRVVALRIEGVKLIVEPIFEQERE